MSFSGSTLSGEPRGESQVQIRKLVGREGPNLFERFVPHGFFSVHHSELLECTR
jgi:hypothetical protein